MASFFALSLQKPRSGRKDTEVLEEDRAGGGRAGVGDLTEDGGTEGPGGC